MKNLNNRINTMLFSVVIIFLFGRRVRKIIPVHFLMISAKIRINTMLLWFLTFFYWVGDYGIQRIITLYFFYTTQLLLCCIAERRNFMNQNLLRERVQAFRNEIHLPISKFAQAIGFERSIYYRWIKGEFEFGAVKAKRIDDYLRRYGF